MFSGGEGSNHWYHVVLMEGRKREVRRMWEAVGVVVNRLKRVRFGPIILNSKVKSGMWRELEKDEQKDLLRITGLRDKRRWGTLKRPGSRLEKKSRPRHGRASNQSKASENPGGKTDHCSPQERG